MPRIDVPELAWVDAVPEFDPEDCTVVPFPVYARVVDHPDGVIAVDTGIHVADVTANASAGWTLPNDDGGNALLGDPQWSLPPIAPTAAHLPLNTGGASGFDAMLGGGYVPSFNPQHEFHGQKGFSGRRPRTW